MGMVFWCVKRTPRLLHYPEPGHIFEGNPRQNGYDLNYGYVIIPVSHLDNRMILSSLLHNPLQLFRDRIFDPVGSTQVANLCRPSRTTTTPKPRSTVNVVVPGWEDLGTQYQLEFVISFG